MIRLKRRRELVAIPKDFIGDKLTAKHVDLIERYFAAKSSNKPMMFDSAKWKSAKAKLRNDTSKKCAYCEASTSTVAHGDVEHFRPKSVYWWLAYDFDNYLFSCQICNQIYKGDHFPITGNVLAEPLMPAVVPVTHNLVATLAATLVNDPVNTTDAAVRQRWIDEDSDIIHPYLEDPEMLFAYEADASNSEIWIRPTTDARSVRVSTAVEKYLGLNREELRRDRYMHYTVIVIFRETLKTATLSGTIRRAIEKEFERRTEYKFPFAGMHRYFLRSWGLY
jgi:hypothetical protein